MFRNFKTCVTDFLVGLSIQMYQTYEISYGSQIFHNKLNLVGKYLVNLFGSNFTKYMYNAL